MASGEPFSAGCLNPSRRGRSILPVDPLANVCWAILELDAVRFATSEKTDNVLIYQR